LRNVAELPRRLQIRLAHLLRAREALLADAAHHHIDLEVRVIALLEPGFERLTGEGRLAQELLKHMRGPRVDAPPLRSRQEDVPGLVAQMIDTVAAAMRIPPKRVSVAAVQLLAALPWRGNLPELRGLLQLLMARVPGPVIRLSDVLDHVHLDGAAVPLLVSGTLREALGIQRTNLYRKIRQLAVPRQNPRWPL